MIYILENRSGKIFTNDFVTTDKEVALKEYAKRERICQINKNHFHEYSLQEWYSPVNYEVIKTCNNRAEEKICL